MTLLHQPQPDDPLARAMMMARRNEASAYAMGVLAHQLANSRLRRLTAPLRAVREALVPRRFGLAALRPALGLEQVSDFSWRVSSPGGEWFIPHVFQPGGYRLRLALRAAAPVRIHLIFDAGTALVQTLRLAAAVTRLDLDHRLTLFAPAYCLRLAVDGATDVTFETFDLRRS